MMTARPSARPRLFTPILAEVHLPTTDANPADTAPPPHGEPPPAPPAVADPSPRACTDHAIVDAARSGDRAAFARLHAEYAPMVLAILLAHARPDDADDLLQDVFLRAMRSIGTLRTDAAVGGWLAAIARNAAADGRRASRGPARTGAALDSAIAPHTAAPDRNLGVHEVLEHLRQLPEAYRESLSLRLIAGMTGPQIARRLGLTEGSVRVNLCRGMTLLRRRLGWEEHP